MTVSVVFYQLLERLKMCGRPKKQTYDVVILTDADCLHPKDDIAAVERTWTEDHLLKIALEARGMRVARKDWTDPHFDWASAKSLLFRTTWNYLNHLDNFTKWLNKASAVTNLINSAELIRWNMDKHYLADLQKKGIRIVESHFIAKGSKASLREIATRLGWKEMVLKPTISGCGRDTYRINMHNIEEMEGVVGPLIEREDFIAQPFLRQIMSKGEVAHIVISCKYSHSILKTPKNGEYRIQNQFGGQIHDYAPSTEEIAFSEQAVKACSSQPLYARVDVLWDNEDQLALSELELIDPEIWLRRNVNAPGKMADAIIEQVSG